MKTVRDLLCPSTEHTKYRNYDSAGEMACVALNDIESNISSYSGDPGPLYPLPERINAVLKTMEARVATAENIAACRPKECWEQ